MKPPIIYKKTILKTQYLKRSNSIHLQRNYIIVVIKSKSVNRKIVKEILNDAKSIKEKGNFGRK